MTIIIISALAIICVPAVYFYRSRSLFVFEKRVSRVLYDLGLDTAKLPLSFVEKLADEIIPYQQTLKEKSNPYLFGTRFFVFTITQNDYQPYNAMFKEGAMVESISLIRAWSKSKKIPEQVAEIEIGRIKDFLLENLPSKVKSEEERLLLEIKILEL